MKNNKFTVIDSFLQSIRSGVSVVFCCTSWSRACKNQNQAMIEVAGIFEEHASVFQFDMARFPEMGEFLSIQSVPTTVIFKDGVELERLIGCQTVQNLHAAIDMVSPDLRIAGEKNGEILSV